MKTVVQKREEFENAYTLTRSVISIYQKLMQLALDGKKDTEEYHSLFSLLQKAIEFEKRAYVGITISTKKKEALEQQLQEAGYENGFYTCDEQTLTILRVLNHYTKSNISLAKVAQETEERPVIQNYVDELFFSLLEQYDHQEDVDKEVKEAAIQVKYALLATSKTVEHDYLGEGIIPITNTRLNNVDIMYTTNAYFGEIVWDTNHYLAMNDDEFTGKDVIRMVYTKACLMLVDPIVTGSAKEELANSIALAKILAALDGKSKKKILKYIGNIFLQQTEISKEK